MKNAKILWIDLEMTGLDPQKDRILEVAAIATDWDFNEIATFESLGGNSIHQDRRFIRAEWKKLEKMLHYRMLDVSAWKVVMSAKFKRVFAKPENHRALDDIRGSIEELKFYLKKVKK